MNYEFGVYLIYTVSLAIEAGACWEILLPQCLCGLPGRVTLACILHHPQCHSRHVFILPWLVPEKGQRETHRQQNNFIFPLFLLL